LAENEDGQEKTEDPTGKKLKESIDEGQLMNSKELMLAAIMLTGCLQMMFNGRYFFNELSGQFRSGLDIKDIILRDVPLVDVAVDRFRGMIMPLVVFAGPILLVTIAARYLFGGLHFVAKNVSLKFGNLSPAKGLGRMVSMAALVELGKAVLKIGVVGVGGVLYLIWKLPAVLTLSELPIEQALNLTGALFIETFLVLVAGTLLIAAIDVIYQWQHHRNQLMMTKQEVREEHKQQDGSPEVKAKIRQMQREAAERGSVANLDQAQVVITNPSHFAVALRYDFEEGTAPKIVAKGSDAIARQIREEAEKAGLPTFSYPLLARALYFTGEVGGEIHTELYRAVAAILSFVFHANSEGDAPVIDVPKELQFDANGRLLERRRV
jgi:flagellar biosynthetic protein FlhB